MEYNLKYIADTRRGAIPRVRNSISRNVDTCQCILRDLFPLRKIHRRYLTIVNYALGKILSRCD